MIAIRVTIHERHGYQLLVRLTASPAPGEALDLPEVPYALHAAGHRLAAELWDAAARLHARWAIDVSYAQVVVTLTEGESIHAAARAATDAALLIETPPRPIRKAAPPRQTKPARKAGRR
jgi:hypothetical protein